MTVVILSKSEETPSLNPLQLFLNFTFHCRWKLHRMYLAVHAPKTWLCFSKKI